MGQLFSGREAPQSALHRTEPAQGRGGGYEGQDVAAQGAWDDPLGGDHSDRIE